MEVNLCAVKPTMKDKLCAVIKLYAADAAIECCAANEPHAADAAIECLPNEHPGRHPCQHVRQLM